MSITAGFNRRKAISIQPQSPNGALPRKLLRPFGALESERGLLVFIGRILDGSKQGGIVPQSNMVIDIFVSVGDREDALGDQIALLMGDVEWVAGIENDGVDAFGETDVLVGEAEK